MVITVSVPMVGLSLVPGLAPLGAHAGCRDLSSGGKGKTGREVDGASEADTWRAFSLEALPNPLRVVGAACGEHGGGV